MLCREVFSYPDRMSTGKMFGQYFHAIAYHTPIVNRTISPSSLYTGFQEQIFNQIKSITHSISNHNPSEMIQNVLVRIQEKDKANSNRSLSIL